MSYPRLLLHAKQFETTKSGPIKQVNLSTKAPPPFLPTQPAMTRKLPRHHLALYPARLAPAGQRPRPPAFCKRVNTTPLPTPLLQQPLCPQSRALFSCALPPQSSLRHSLKMLPIYSLVDFSSSVLKLLSCLNSHCCLINDRFWP